MLDGESDYVELLKDVKLRVSALATVNTSLARTVHLALCLENRHFVSTSSNSVFLPAQDELARDM